MRALYVPVPDETMERLREIGAREWRSPKEQAGLFIAEGVERRLTGDAVKAAEEPASDVASEPERHE
jgi:hypothetical protein